MGLTRSQQMSRIRARDTKPELALRKALWRAGLRYRVHARTPIGRPDIVFPGPRVAVFVDGCFWHGCPAHYVRPRSSTAFWSEKLATNVRRDTEQTRRLENLGWRVCRVWEHEVFENPRRAVSGITAAVRANRWQPGESWRVFKVDEVDAATDRERRLMRELRQPERKRSKMQRRSTKKWKTAVRV